MIDDARLAYIKMLLRGWHTTKSNFAWYLGLMAKAKTAWPDLYEKALTETWSGEMGNG